MVSLTTILRSSAKREQRIEVAAGGACYWGLQEIDAKIQSECNGFGSNNYDI